MLKERIKNKRTLIAAGALIIVLIALFLGLTSGRTPIEAIVVLEEPFTERIVAIGRLGLAQETSLIAQVSGEVQSISVSEGESISTGALFIEIENQVSLEYASAESEYNRLGSLIAYSGSAYNNAQTLYNEGAISKVEMQDRKYEYESALAQFASAKLALEQASANRSKYQVTVPWNAIVLKTYVSVGDYVQLGNLLADIGSAEGYKISTELDEKYFPYIYEGIPVAISVGDESAGAAVGKIESITPKINENTGTFEIRISLPKDYPYQVSNLTVNLEIITKEIAKAITIPKSYLFEQENGTDAYVFVYDQGKASKQLVKIQAGLSPRVVVLEGLSAGDILLFPEEGLKDGDVVKKYREADAS